MHAYMCVHKNAMSIYIQTVTGKLNLPSKLNNQINNFFPQNNLNAQQLHFQTHQFLLSFIFSQTLQKVNDMHVYHFK
jgi:hypothetical protein